MIPKTIINNIQKIANQPQLKNKNVVNDPDVGKNDVRKVYWKR